MRRKRKTDLVIGAANEQLEFSVALVKVDRDNDRRHAEIGQAAAPDVDPFAVAASCPCQIAVIERLGELPVAGVCGTARTVNHDLAVGDEQVGIFPEA